MKLRTITLVPVAVAVVLYAVVVFITLQPDVLAWTQEGRFWFVFATAWGSLMATLFLNEL